MRCTLLFIHIILFIALSGPLAFAREQQTHHAYRITSYNLGAILNFHKKNALFEATSFNSLMITSSTSDILNNELNPSAFWVETTPHTPSGKGIALSAQFKATEKISLQGAFGITRNLWTPDNVEYENESSWEANLGLIYRLVDNLSYEIHFGYMDTGDLFSDQAAYTDVENIIMVSNRLTMSF